MKVKLLFVPLFLFIFLNTNAQRESLSLKEDAWKLWLDKEAGWENDTLFLPGTFEVSELPFNPPGCGWEQMYSEKGIECRIPATVEEYFAHGDPLFTYHGVSWFWREVEIPSNWSKKQILIKFSETRLRAELYINNKLAAYDLVAETPWQADVTGYLIPGIKNMIAVRITNPGGHRGWEDFPAFNWGKYEFPSSHDFGGISGDVSLVATNDLFIENVFIQNVLPANENKIAVSTTLLNKNNKDKKVEVQLTVEEPETDNVIYSTKYNTIATSGNKSISTVEFSVPSAKLWDIKEPELYICRVKISEKKAEDEITERFGFRVFEVKESGGQDNFYLNGKRFVHKSAIDWGYYAGTGLYATDAMASRSVDAAIAIGHNGINFHRCIGEPLVMKYADESGLLIYEEPGGFHAGQQGNTVTDGTFGGEVMLEKCRRMVIRDRNHPSLIIHNLCNEDNYWNPLREKVMKMINILNPACMVSNSSGGYIFDIYQASPSNYINHIRPYEDSIRNDFEDNHTVEESGGVFNESFLFSHTYQTNNLQYWGEVHCYGGPDNWYKTATELEGKPNWDRRYFQPLYQKTLDYFEKNNISGTGSKSILSPSDVSSQTGRGLMYINGRAVQNLLSINQVDGFGINGWSGTSQVVPGAGGYWSSALVDEARNLKGVAEDYAYWARDLQVCIKRMNGNIFTPEEVGLFEITLINHNKLEKGLHLLKIKIKDGKGVYTSYEAGIPVYVEGEDVFSQFIKILPVKFRNWTGGYITIEANLYQGNELVADGSEQVLLKNRPSFQNTITGFTGAVYQWDEAASAIRDAKVPIRDYHSGMAELSYICAGEIPEEPFLDEMLQRVKSDGTTLLIRFTEKWAKVLHRKGFLSEVPAFQHCRIEGSWMGNGWGYLDHFVGDQAVPGISTIGTNSWELGTLSREKIQSGFWPLDTNHPEVTARAYGAHMARPDVMLVLIGELEYGKGRIILDAAYTIDNEHAFTDLLFYNLISKGSKYKYTTSTSLKSPYNLIPAEIPGIVEAENYDNGGEGISYHDYDQINEGNEYRNDGVDISSSGAITFVGWIHKGEWLEYTINAIEGGTYNITFHYATPNTGLLDLVVNGTNKAANIQLPTTGDWYAFRMFDTTVKLEQGKQVIRILFKEGGINLSSMNFRFLE